MKLNIAFASATAIGLLLATGVAWAGSNNTLYIQQSGGTNSASVTQFNGPGGNDIGSAADPFLQQGNGNTFNEIQATGGGFSRGDNDILKARQLGDHNSFTSYYSNNAGWNRINDVLQYGNSNALSIERNNQLSGTVGTVVQGAEASAPSGGNGNGISISQSTYPYPYGQPPFTGGNTVALVKQIGSNNAYGYYAGTSIDQGGSSNMVVEATIEGSNNSPLAGAGQSIVQRGTGNGLIASTAITLGSNGTGIKVTESGNSNNFDVRQGLSASSTGNYAVINQGYIDNPYPTADTYFQVSYNNATATQFGDGNRLIVNQFGDSNSTTANFTGDDNGVGSFTSLGAAAALASSSGGKLTQGTILQDSSLAASGNTVSYTVSGNANLFAFAQIGGSNTVSGTVTSSSHNEAAVLQNSSNNTASFSQAGAGANIAAISQ